MLQPAGHSQAIIKDKKQEQQQQKQQQLDKINLHSEYSLYYYVKEREGGRCTDLDPPSAILFIFFAVNLCDC